MALSTRRTEALAPRPLVADPVVAHVPKAAAAVGLELEGVVGSAVVECGAWLGVLVVVEFVVPLGLFGEMQSSGPSIFPPS